jgi:hypothetical protein
MGIARLRFEVWRPFFGPCPEPTLKAAFSGRSGSDADNAPVNRPAPTSTGSRPGVRPGRRLAVLALALPLLTPAARADDRRDHERARAAVQAGLVLPLPALLERVQRQAPGQVLEVELEQGGGRWIYELKLLQPGGQLVKLEVDAATGKLLAIKRRKDVRGSGGAPR